MLIRSCIYGKKVTLRDIELSDCNENYLAWLQDFEINQYMETRFENQTIEKIVDFVDANRKSTNNIIFAILDAKTEKHIGNIKIGAINRNNLNADISYFIGDKNFWNKGYATEAVKLVIDYSFQQLKLHRLSAGVIAGNHASEVLLRKVGMRLEGICTEGYLVDGKFTDAYKYCLINPMR